MSVYNNLKTVQHVLGAMESNNVNTVGANLESMEVLRIMEEVYFELMAYGEWPHLEELRQLESISDADRPTYLRIPDAVATVQLLKYDMEKLEYLTPIEFIELSHKRDIEADNVIELSGFNSVQLLILNDTAPTYWTSFDEEHIVLDSFDATVSATLQSNKSLILCKTTPTWLVTDEFIPDMPVEMFPTYLAKVKSRAFLQLKREQSVPDERQAAVGMSKIRREVSKLNDRSNHKDSRYGRSSKGRS